MIKIGLTGGVGSGKSTIAEMFAAKGVDIIDTDRIAHQITSPQGECYQMMIEHFGNEIVTATGELDRQKLREIVFDQPEQRKWLGKNLHPIILRIMQEKMATAKPPYCIAVVPLLIEANLVDYFNRILVVDVPEEVQLQRASQRDDVSIESVVKILDTQCNREQRLKQADDIIDNSGNLNNLQPQIEKLHRIYTKSGKHD